MKLPQSPFFKKKLREKVHDAVWEDKRKYGLSALTTPAARKVVEDCTGRCDNCDCELLFNGWQPWCLHQFSLDRVDLTKPHGPENMRVLCYCCNAQIATTRDPAGLIMKVECPKMSCKSGCHIGSAPRAPDQFPSQQINDGHIHHCLVPPHRLALGRKIFRFGDMADRC